MKKSQIWIIAGLAALALGCSGNKEASTPSTGPGGAKTQVEVQAFKGGYDIDFYQTLAKEYSEKHPDVEVKVDGDPRVWEKLRPRFQGGNPPDLTFPGWGMDHWKLAEEGQLEDLGPALAEKPSEGEGTWGDTFKPQILKLGQLDGKQYVLPYYVMLFGWWYDPGVFEKNGWTAPKTYNELLALCEKIKAKGIAPITFQGKYPYYMIDGMLLPWTLSVGGPEALVAAQNMEPGAWKSPAVLQAAKMIDQLNKKGYFQDGAVGMTHTEAQQGFLNGKAAMVPCGSWLESEMKKSMPEGAKIQYMMTPVADGGKGDPSSVQIGIEPWMVPAKAKNKKQAIDFYKYMTSVSNAKRFVTEKASLMSIQGSDDVTPPPSLAEPIKAYKASKFLWSVQYRAWYPKFNTEIENKLTAMLTGELTPEQFCDAIEAAAEKVRQDATIKKHKVAQ